MASVSNVKELAPVTLNQPSMAAGEIAPDLYGRVDQELYYIGMRTILNFVVRQYGGTANRPGTQFICEAKDSSKALCLVDFSYNEVQNYIIEVGNNYMRFIMNAGEIVETAKNITGITKANPGVVTSAAHGFSNGQDVALASILGMIELNGRSVRVANVAANTFELTDYAGNNINTTNYTTYVSGGTASRIYEITTTYAEADLFVLPSRASLDPPDVEGFGIVFLEAAACGTPSLGGASGGVPDAVLDGETGFLVDPEDPTNIAEKILLLMSDRNLLASLSTRARAHAEASTWAKARPRYFAAMLS